VICVTVDIGLAAIVVLTGFWVETMRAQLHRWLNACLALITSAITGCSSTLTMPPDSRQSGQHVIGDSSARTARDLVRVQAVDTALSMVGAPYKYGGSGPDGFDCSGLVYFAYDAAGVTLPRTTTQLLRASDNIALHEALEGDLLFFEITSKPDHVGIFIGNGQFVHAPSSGKHVSIGTLDDPYWRSSFVSAGRLDR